jgi:hypothetical protein
MSPAPRFRVTLILSRMLTLEPDAPTTDAAEAIARYMFGAFGSRHFDSTPEEIVDVLVDDIAEARS